jgi:riboflavin synthase
MFTGIVETMGTVLRVTAGKGSSRLAVRSSLPVSSMSDGESVAVDGVCLTVARRSGAVVEMDAVAETLSLTTLGSLRAGDPVHLERALTLADRLGGHLVQGHVDGVARVVSLTRRGDDVRLTLALPAPLRRYAAPKGSIAVSGVSLTIARRSASSIEIALVPATLSRTKLGKLRAGNRLNVEMDLIARYLEVLTRERR